MRTPVTLNAAQRAADLQRNNSSETGISAKADLPTAQPEVNSKSMNDSATKPNKQALQLEAARKALAAPTATPRNATAGVDPLAEVDGAVSTLDPDEIEIYKHNPRTRPNPKREEIKASMIAEGRITNTIMVTRRSPAENIFPMVAVIHEYPSLKSSSVKAIHALTSLQSLLANGLVKPLLFPHISARTTIAVIFPSGSAPKELLHTRQNTRRRMVVHFPRQNLIRH